MDKAGGPNTQLMYPAPNLAGFIAAIATHAVLVGNEKSSQKQKILAEADYVLSPYQSVLGLFTLEDLFKRCTMKNGKRQITLTTVEKSQADIGPIVEASPSYSMTQDQKAILLSNDIVLRGVKEGSSNFFKGTIKVVSKPAPDGDMPEYWMHSEGENLKNVSARLLADSIDVAFQLSGNQDSSSTAPFRTFRYPEGGSEKMERGQAISESCEQIILKTLRGEILVVPGRC